MIKYENDCCNCSTPLYPCDGSHKRVPHFYCDECGQETDIYYFDGDELCIDCVEARLEVVTV